MFLSYSMFCVCASTVSVGGGGVLERKYQTTGNDWTGTIHLHGYGASSIGPLGSEIM